MTTLFSASIMITSLLSAHLTYLLIHRFKMNSVRSSSLITLIFILVIAVLPVAGWALKLQAAAFGGSFVGMSDASRLCEKRVLAASLIFGAFFCFMSQFKGGIGGTLGALAFASCAIVYFLFPSGTENVVE